MLGTKSGDGNGFTSLSFARGKERSRCPSPHGTYSAASCGSTRTHSKYGPSNAVTRMPLALLAMRPVYVLPPGVARSSSSTCTFQLW